jgi:hypothetical protein
MMNNRVAQNENTISKLANFAKNDASAQVKALNA